MQFATFAVCADFKTADLTSLGSIGWAERSHITPFLQEMKRHFAIEECFFLQSCNRREFYFYAPDLNMDLAQFLPEFFAKLSESLGKALSPKWFRLFEGQHAVRRLFRVASSLESMVLGETEIMKQLRDQLADSIHWGNSGKRLRALIDGALRTAKRVRTQTKITHNVTSMASLIHRAVRDHLGGRSGRVVFVGAGHFMTSILPPFAKMTHCEFVFVNRTLPVSLAEANGGTARSLEDFLANPGTFDALISATSAPHVLFDANWLDAHQKDCGLLLVDGALPGDIHRNCAQRKHTHVLDLAHLEEILAKNRAQRQAEVPKAEPIFQEAILELEERWKELDLGTIHAGVASYYQETAQRALDCLFKQGAIQLDEDQRQLMLQFSQGLARRLVSVPVLGLKGVARELGHDGVSAWKRGVSSGSPLFAHQ